MSERLRAIISLIRPADMIADVGCDHALVARHLIRAGLCKTVIASDISEKCLAKAKSLLAGEQNVRFVCCDGIKFECDEAVIAGMSGNTIAKILSESECKPQTLVLCPHRDHAAARRALISLGYGIEIDMPMEERGKLYFVIRAALGAGVAELSELQLHYGADVQRPNAALAAHLIRLQAAYMRAPEQNAGRLELVNMALSYQTAHGES